MEKGKKWNGFYLHLTLMKEENFKENVIQTKVGRHEFFKFVNKT